ncbi:unnamed protein product [Psylliodes chrysocephalus]|uniref:DUF7869 domain-containing protein n=1 Tax=Psylliodes chrysocephalus TaxID=3402493 RepID=A0A9P0GKT4_9CUCU|nr:unnamed protein product [Psylliodes chrysocephala]
MIENKPEMFRIKLCSYRSIFVNEFNLSFAKPKSDTCSTCDAGKSNEEHIENYHTAFESMKIDRELAQTSDNVVYNFGIHIEAKGVSKSIFCTWTENQGSKGSIDIFCSLLTAVESDEILRSKYHLIIWSDSCGGQNKNFLLICLYQYFVHKNMFKVIDHKYPEVGHTYLDSDRDFGRIEKNLRNHEVLFTPEQYRHIITKSGRKNLVIDMSNHFRVTERDMKLYNRKKDLLKEKVRFRDGIKWFRVEHYGSYMFKECYDYHTPFKKVSVTQVMNVIPHIDNIVIVRNPNRKNVVSKEKIENLKEQLQFVPDEHQWFYRNIITEHEAAAED